MDDDDVGAGVPVFLAEDFGDGAEDGIAGRVGQYFEVLGEILVIQQGIGLETLPEAGGELGDEGGFHAARVKEEDFLGGGRRGWRAPPGLRHGGQ